MPVDQKLRRLAFQKLDRQLARLAKRTAPENVHRFRTYGRRVEALIDGLVKKPSRNEKKLLKLLGRLRKKAGRARDLDVQISLLQALKIPQESARKAHLVRLLMDERAGWERKLEKCFDRNTVSELQKRVKRTSKEVASRNGFEPLRLALQEFALVSRNQGPVSEKVLHQYRVSGKRARYLAELEEKNPAAQRMVEQLKRMQDVIGDWHDWLKLTERAESLLGTVEQSALVAALTNITRAKFRMAVDALNEARRAVLGKPSAAEASLKKAPAADTQAQAAAA